MPRTASTSRPSFRSRERAVDVGLHHRAAGIGLERDRLGDPALAEAVEELVEQRLDRGREGLEEAVLAFQHGARPDEAGAAEQRGAQARLRGPAGVHALGPAAVAEIFDDARGHRLRRCRALPSGPVARAPIATPPAKAAAGRAEHRRRVEAGLVDRLGRHEAEAAEELGAGRQPSSTARPTAVAFGRGQHRRHDHRTGMDRAALEGVVEVLAVGGRAVDERGIGGGEPVSCPMATWRPRSATSSTLRT